MNPATHQTVKLSKGRHASPEEGACVMELASMLAGEAFSDHPNSVCPVISSFLRTYNDSVDDARRQALYEYASRVVGTRGSKEAARARAEYLGSLLADLRLRRAPWIRLVPEGVRALLRPRIDMIPARTARMIAANERRMKLSVRATIDGLLKLGGGVASGDAFDRALEMRSVGLDRVSESERVLGLR